MILIKKIFLIKKKTMICGILKKIIKYDTLMKNIKMKIIMNQKIIIPNSSIKNQKKMNKMQNMKISQTTKKKSQNQN